jgi:hypothetical protein
MPKVPREKLSTVPLAGLLTSPSVQSPTIALPPSQLRRKTKFPRLDQAGFEEIYLHSIRDAALERFAKWKADNNVLPVPEHIDAKDKRYKRRNKRVEEVYKEEGRESKRPKIARFLPSYTCIGTMYSIMFSTSLSVSHIIVLFFDTSLGTRNKPRGYAYCKLRPLHTAERIQNLGIEARRAT